MVEQELWTLIGRIITRQCEEQTTEVKAAHLGCPEKLYDTISAFSNQNSGGTFVFGLDEKQGFKKVGVYNPQDLQKKVMEYCEQMTPVVRPVFTVCEQDALVFVSAEIPPVDIAERPCFKTAKGRLQGSYIRVGDADKPMTEYEVYSYEAYRKKYRDDIRPVTGASIADLDAGRLEDYLLRRKYNRPNLASLPPAHIYDLTGITRAGEITMTAIMLFGLYPQARFPQLGVIATHVPGTEMGVLDADGRRFTDSRRIEGTLPEMLEGSLAFVRSNMRVSTRVDGKTGERVDIPQYPMDAVREAILNALVHRDYSIYTEGMPIQITMYSNRLEIISPGGLYGRLTVDQLGNAQPDTRNPVMVTAMEFLGKTENRYSGIPRIREAMRELSLPEPVFENARGTFTVKLYGAAQTPDAESKPSADVDISEVDPKGLIAFCKQPRTRAEIEEYLAISSKHYAIRRYLQPLVDAGLINLTIPDRPRSPRQMYVSR